MPVRRGILALLLSVKRYRKAPFYVMAREIEQAVRRSLSPLQGGLRTSGVALQLRQQRAVGMEG